MSSNIYVLIRSWNAFPYLERCLDSLNQQKDQNFTILFIDDCSDYTRDQKKYIRSRINGHICLFNTERKYSLRNAYEAIHTFIENKNDIIINLDADDWLIRDDVIHQIRSVYLNNECHLTYGNCCYFDPKSKFHLKDARKLSNTTNFKYPLEIEQSGLFRKTHFRPLHLRTWKSHIFKLIKRKSFMRPDNTWIRFCEDQAMFYPMLEMSPQNYLTLSQVYSVYNQENSLNDSKVNFTERMLDELIILKQPKYDQLF